MTSSLSDLRTYLGRVREFTARDWLVYLSWVGLIAGLAVSSGAFLGLGRHHGVRYPAAAWWVPAGAAVFTLAIAVDTIGHRTIYRAEIRKIEGLVHGITIFC